MTRARAPGPALRSCSACGQFLVGTSIEDQEVWQRNMHKELNWPEVFRVLFVQSIEMDELETLGGD